MKVIQTSLPVSEYFKESQKKKQIYLHHTAGGHNGKAQASYWSKDNLGRVATAYVIGGISTRDLDVSHNGVAYQCFEDQYWAYHLGLKTSQNLALNKGSVGIEICNYGPLKYIDGKYLTYVQSSVPDAMVYQVEKKWRGFDFYHKYTDLQLESTKQLLIQIANKHSIDIKKKWDYNSFGLSNQALEGQPGLWTHCNVRNDKFDCHPQPELIDMLNSL